MAQYECLYTKDNIFVIAKEVGWQWGSGERSSDFIIKIEDLSPEELKEKYVSIYPETETT